MSRTACAGFAVTLLLYGCGDAPDRPAKPEQIEQLNQVIERFPALGPTRDAANADGVITEHEIIAIFEQAEALPKVGD